MHTDDMKFVTPPLHLDKVSTTTTGYQILEEVGRLSQVSQPKHIVYIKEEGREVD